MMGGLNIRDAAPTASAVVDSGMIERLRDRHAPLERRNTVAASGSQGVAGGRGGGGVGERRKEKHQVLYDDGSVRWE